VNEKLIAQLREEADRFDPQPPPGLRRRLLATLANAPAVRRPRPTTPIYWSVAACATALAVAVVAFALRDRSPVHPPVVIVPQTQQWAIKPLPSPAALSASANPIALAQRWVEEPLQREVETWRNHLTSATDTVTGVFPAPVKRQRAGAL
jgi:hypothetical protein